MVRLGVLAVEEAEGMTTKVVCLSGVPCDSRGAHNVCLRELLVLEMFNAQCDVCHDLRDRQHELRIFEVQYAKTKGIDQKDIFLGTLKDPDMDSDDDCTEAREE
jgi:hypothetical protein